MRSLQHAAAAAAPCTTLQATEVEQTQLNPFLHPFLLPSLNLFELEKNQGGRLKRQTGNASGHPTPSCAPTVAPSVRAQRAAARQDQIDQEADGLEDGSEDQSEDQSWWWW